MAAVRVRGLLAPAPAPQFWRVAPLWRRCHRALCSYAKLGLQRGASDDAVRQAFREAAQRHHPDKAGGDRARFEECKAAADAILDRTEGDEPPRWQRRSKPAEDRDDESHWDHGFGSSERVYNDERDFDRPEDPEQRANDSARVHYIFKVLLGNIAARFFVVGIFSKLPTEPDLVRRKLQAEAELPLRAATMEVRAPARAARPRAARTERQLHRRWPEQPAARFCASNSNQRGSSHPAPASAAGRALSGGGGAAHLRTAAPDDALNPIHVRPGLQDMTTPHKYILEGARLPPRTGEWTTTDKPG